jgi:hypothetical protein
VHLAVYDLTDEASYTCAVEELAAAKAHADQTSPGFYPNLRALVGMKVVGKARSLTPLAIRAQDVSRHTRKFGESVFMFFQGIRLGL